MASDHDERVRERAYHRWQESGSDPGREMEHWLEAEREVAASAGSASAKPAAARSTTANPKSARAEGDVAKAAVLKPSGAKPPAKKAQPAPASAAAKGAKAGEKTIASATKPPSSPKSLASKPSA